MEYSGKLYGKVGSSYIPLINTTEDFENLQNRVKALEVENKELIVTTSQCICSPGKKHGETSIMCCNHCGRPTETFWIKTKLK